MLNPNYIRSERINCTRTHPLLITSPCKSYYRCKLHLIYEAVSYIYFFFHIRINPWRDRTHCRLIYAAALSATVVWFIAVLLYCTVDVVPDYTLYKSSSVQPTAAAYTQAEGNLPTSWRHIGGVQVRLHSFLTSIQVGHHTPGKELRYPMNRRRGGYQEFIRTLWRREKSLISTWIPTPGLPALSLMTKSLATVILRKAEVIA